MENGWIEGETGSEAVAWALVRGGEVMSYYGREEEGGNISEVEVTGCSERLMRGWRKRKKHGDAWG